MFEKTFGLTCTNVGGAPEALVSFFKWFGGQPDGKSDFSLFLLLWMDPWWEPLKEGEFLNTTYSVQYLLGLSLNTVYLVQYVLTVDLRLRLALLLTVDLKT